MAEKRFKVALSFPGEHRAFIEEVATHLALEFGKPQILYDKYHKAEFAQPDLDIYLPELYKNESELVVYFLCEDYANKEWCGLEWRIIREMIKQRKRDMLMQFKFDLHPVPGDLTIDGYIEISTTKEALTAKEVADLIVERYKINEAKTRKLASIDGPTGISMLQKLEKDIAELKDARQSPTTELQIAALTEEKETLRLQLLQKDEIIEQQKKTRLELETSLSATKGNEELKQKALEALEAKDYDEAEELLKESAKDRMAQVAEDFHQLGTIKELKLEYTEALRYYELAAKMPPYNAVYLKKAGELCRMFGLLDKAMQYCESSLEIDIINFGELNGIISAHYNDIGVIWLNKGDFKKAIYYIEKALKINLELFENENPKIASNYNNLGEAWRNIGNPDMAIEYFQKALKINLNLYGKEHPDIAIRYNNLGLAWKDKGDIDKAIKYLGKALKIDMQFPNKRTLNVAIRYNNLGEAWRQKGNLSKALSYVNKSLGIHLELFGEEHPHTAICYNNIGIIWHNIGNLTRAIEYTEKSYNIFIKLDGPRNHMAKSIKENLDGYIINQKINQ